ncbi:MAG: chemotaxis protein CheA [Alteromonadaceae bacterium]|nr:MAG: chemotaxis protein CheA [Alteromonadaceae bacterium]
MDESLQVFADEAEDLLALAEQALLNLDNLNNEAETLEGVNDLFRTFHTIKGAAGLFGLDAIVKFTHIVESVLVKVREASITLTDDIVSLFLLSQDHLEALVASALGNADVSSDALLHTNTLLAAQLKALLLEPKEAVDELEDEPIWGISLQFGPNAMRNGMDPASFIHYLSKIGELVHLELDYDRLPEWEDFEPEACFLSFEIKILAPNTTKEELEAVFEFVQDDCKISILPPHCLSDQTIKAIEDLPDEDMRIGNILVTVGALTNREKDDILNTQDRLVDEVTAAGGEQKAPPLGVVAVEQNVVQQSVIDAAVKRQGLTNKNRDESQQTLRVNSQKLESLVNLVGELVISSANSELKARELADIGLNEAMENLLRLVEEVRDTALGLRMVQIGETFNRFKRVVREVGRDLGKDIELVLSGTDTELDKTLVEKIGDPLMHLVRNAIDHGIESPDKRLAAGKSARGTVNLDAFHDSGSIVIQVKDDGGGLSKEKILTKALDKGLIPKDHKLTDQEIYRLIFEAGFSTADTVSNLSGRGVGMDVVRRNIESLRGQVEIDSVAGKSTTISVRLPLTLAIIDGFQVRVGDAQYIVPLDMIDECIELTEALRGTDKDANYVNLRGEILPFVHLCDMFDIPCTVGEHKRDNIVVVQCAGKKAGFIVDELLGEHQTVIKPLGKVFKNLKGISGATILGSGKVAMIVDIPELMERVTNESY